MMCSAERRPRVQSLISPVKGFQVEGDEKGYSLRNPGDLLIIDSLSLGQLSGSVPDSSPYRIEPQAYSWHLKRGSPHIMCSSHFCILCFFINEKGQILIIWRRSPHGIHLISGLTISYEVLWAQIDGNLKIDSQREGLGSQPGLLPGLVWVFFFPQKFSFPSSAISQGRGC